MTKEKPTSKEDQPSSTFVSATGRLHTPQGVVLVSVVGWPGSQLYLIANILSHFFCRLNSLTTTQHKVAATKPEEFAESK